MHFDRFHMPILLTAVLLVASCGPENLDTEAVSQRISNLEQNLDVDNIEGNIRFFLTDAPLDGVAEVNVTVNGLRIKPHEVPSEEEGGEEEAEPIDDENVVPSEPVEEGEISAPEEGEQPIEEEEPIDDEEEVSDKWQTMIFDEPLVLNLLDLQNGISSILGDLELPTGLYKEIRLLVSKSEVVGDDDQVEVLKIPGGHKNGLKIKFSGEGAVIEQGKLYALVLDFDIAKSLKRKGPKGPKKTIAETALAKKDDHPGKKDKPEDKAKGPKDHKGKGKNGDASASSEHGPGNKHDKKSKSHGRKIHENEAIEGRTWILKPVIKVLYLAEINGGELDPQLVDEEDEGEETVVDENTEETGEEPADESEPVEDSP